MKKIGKKIRITLLALILFAISAVWIIANGRTYTIEISNTDNIKDAQQINVIIENENIAKCIDKSIEEAVIKIKLESISKGKTFIDIKNDEGTLSHLSSIYVHNFGEAMVNNINITGGNHEITIYSFVNELYIRGGITKVTCNYEHSRINKIKTIGGQRDFYLNPNTEKAAQENEGGNCTCYQV